MDEKLLFFSTFLKNPKEIGSVVPSSKFLVNELLKCVDFKSAKYIVEYGSGTGRITREILKRASPGARILCFETNKRLYNYLKRSIKDKRVTIINDSAENIIRHLKRLGIPKIDYAISSLPFSNLSYKKKITIISETEKTLNRDGRFVIYQYFKDFRKYLYEYFSNISTKFVALNIPPCVVYICGK
ncbi:methyltransferase [Candidatus Woesearchaeota archaeon]|nr:methyltransferase [Candidatus Woesearchaeota archaeon]